jgi:hypothetical protein
MRRGISISILLIIGGKEIFAQKQTENFQQVWTGYFNQTRFTNRWGTAIDMQLRTKDDFFNQLSQFLIRPSIVYYINDGLRLSAGYAHFRFYPADNHRDVTQPEHRIWQQVQWLTKYRHNKTIQTLRFEQRYIIKILNDSTLANGYNFNYRLRYNFLWQIPLISEIKKGAFSIILNNEVFVNFGKQIVYNYFDQNRLFAGFAYHTNSSDYLQFGYMNIFQQIPTGNRYRSTHIARVGYVQNLDLRKKKN